MALTKKKIKDQDRVSRSLQFLGLGVEDYLAARVLLNNRLVPQGTILASTAIEKYFKAIIALRGNEVHGHLKKAHIESIRNYDPKLFVSLNNSFLEMLQKIYDLRYLDATPGFTISLVRRPILAELDFTVATIQAKLEYFRNSERCRTKYDHLIETKDARLFDENYLLAGQDKTAFIEQRDIVYGIRIDEILGIIEASYEIEKATADGDFLKPGLTPGNETAAQSTT